MRMRTIIYRAASATAALTGAACGQYQWTAVPLHPGGASFSHANAVSGSLQGGTVKFSGDNVRPVLWNGSADSWSDLTPSWALGGVLNGMDASAQVGQLAPAANVYHAAMWRGTPESAVDLNPDGYRASEAFAVSEGMQAGMATHTQSGQLHAALWRGTAESFIDLNPVGSNQSRAFATDGTLQGGWATLPGGGQTEAVIWSGSAESVVNLAPQGATDSSVNAMAPGVQVGNFRYPFQNRRAALWRGSADSLVDLSPPGSIASELYGTDGSMHVGAAAFGFDHAGIWLSDDPASFVDLHTLLPPQYYLSWATDVFVDGGTIYVTGTATDGPESAWLWVGTIPAPGTGALMGLGLLCSTRRRR